MKWGHDQLADDLAAHLRTVSDRMVWTNMQLGPSGSPRPDVYTAPKSYTKFAPIAYEIKVSVPDFRSDVTSGKWQSYLKFAAGVIFAVPAGLITKADLPIGCGLVIRGESGWTTVKAPTLSPVNDFPRDAFIKLLIDGVDRAKHPLPGSRAANTWRANDAIRKKYGDDIAEALSRRDAAASNFDYSCAQFKAQLAAEQVRHDKKRQELREEMQRERSRIDEDRAVLCKALGLESDASVWEIKSAAFRAAQALNRDDEIARLRNQLGNALKTLERAAKEILQDTPALLANDNAVDQGVA